MKKVAILLLSFERAELLARTLPHNISNAGCPVDVIALDQGSKDPEVMKVLQAHCAQVHQSPTNLGIGGGMNYLLKCAYDQGYEYFQFMANDILEDDGWIALKISACLMFPGKKGGMISTYPGPGEIPYEAQKYQPEFIHDYDTLVVHAGHVIGQFMITRSVVEKVGYFKTFDQPYAPIDNDYNVRCEKSGFVNFYIPTYRAHHLDPCDDIYGYDKAQKIEQTWPVHVEDANRYNESNSFLPYDDGECTINMVQMI